MNKSVFRKVQFISNIAIIVLAFILTAFLLKQIIFPSSNNVATTTKTVKSGGPLNLVGKPIPMGEVEWSKHKLNVVLYISSTCRFCTESSQFYQQIAKESEQNKDINLVAVLPQPLEEGQNYLKKLSLEIENVYQIEPEVIGLRGTPTILIVNENGVITNVWMGKLSPEREEQVLGKLKI